MPDLKKHLFTGWDEHVWTTMCGRGMEIATPDARLHEVTCVQCLKDLVEYGSASFADGARQQLCGVLGDAEGHRVYSRCIERKVKRDA